MNDISTKYLLFEVDEQYALEVKDVVEIIENTAITRVPETPDYVAGIINLRGHVVPVINVRKRFRKPERPDIRQRCIVICEIEGHSLGLLVDNVVDLVEFSPEQIKEAPQVGGNFVHVFVKSIAVVGDAMHLVVDADRLINYNDLFFVEKAEGLMGASADALVEETREAEQ